VDVIYLPDVPWVNRPVYSTIGPGDSWAGVCLGVCPWLLYLFYFVSRMSNKKSGSVGLIFLVLCLLSGCSDRLPSDESLIEQFTSNQSKFETAIEMMGEDTSETALYKIARDYIQYEAGREGEIDEQRAEEYRCLFDELNWLSITHYRGDTESFLITVYAEGWSPEGGIYKGYEYFPEGLPEKHRDRLVESLEYAPDEYESGTWLYRRIDENWYLWFLY
jgi:hypothetical protein